MKTKSRTISIGLCAWALGATVAAQAAAPLITDLAMVPRLTIQSDVGTTNQIQYTNNLGQSNWAVLTNVVVTQSPYYFVDVTAPPAPKRFYRVVPFYLNSAAPSGMVLIPAGSFTMGDANDGDPYGDAPTHPVNVSAFYMDTNLVTYTLWTNVYQWATNRPADVRYSFDHAGSGKAGSYPVQTVSWYDVVKWCNARSEMAGLTPCYYTNASQSQMTIYRSGQFDLATNWVSWVGNGSRLPTEAEWEKAARGGASGHRFPWSDADTINWSRANYYAWPLSAGGYAYDVNPTEGYNPAGTSGGYPYTTPVGTFAPNGYGLYDMAGNVMQWCWDWYSSTYYSSSPGTDPHGPASASYRLLRGGLWNYNARYARCAYRYNYAPSNAGNYFGFRCVRGL